MTALFSGIFSKRGMVPWDLHRFGLGGFIDFFSNQIGANQIGANLIVFVYFIKKGYF